MVLKGKRKKVAQDIVRFYMDNTGVEYDEFIVNMLKVEATHNFNDYNLWLAKQSLKILEENEVTLNDCVTNKDVLRAAVKVNSDQSRQEGEFYTPEVWAAEGRKHLEESMGDLWGKAIIWDASCGTGNLLKTLENYPPELVFQSTKDQKDVDLILEQGSKWNTFQCDFLTLLDDEFATEFTDTLPERIQQALRNNEPIAFYMNPPYKIGKAESTDIGAYMKTHGMSKCALDIYHHFIYRIMMFKEVFNHTNMYITLIGPSTIYQSSTIEELYNELKRDHIFDNGMAFAIGEFSNVKGGTDWVVSLTSWRPKLETDGYANPVLLPTKTSDIDGNVKVIGERLYSRIGDSLHYWALPDEGGTSRASFMLPIVSTFNTFSGLGKAWEGVLGYLMSSPHAIRGVRRTCVTTLPNGDNLPLVEENFWRCVASFSARRCYAQVSNGYDNSQYLAAPDTELEGYNQWLMDSVVLFLYDIASCQTSYRDLYYNETIKGITLQNNLFPLSYEEVGSIITDEVLLEDYRNNPPTNQFILKVLEEVEPHLSSDARALHECVKTMFRHSLQSDVRARVGYGNWLQSWNAGIYQLRKTVGEDNKSVFSQEQLEEYMALTRNLKAHLLSGVYSFGFMRQSVESITTGGN